MNKKRIQASQHDFAMVPRADIPRSSYMLQATRKTTFDAGRLIPIYCEEILPGDHFAGNMTVFGRFATPIVPVMDNAELETFFFFVPNRIVWDHWEPFITGENYAVPYIACPAGGFTALSIYDQFGIPCAGQIDPAGIIHVNALPFRAYNLIYNEWFRDQNLITKLPVYLNDGPDPSGDYSIQYRGKKHDYFTSSLPWPQKGTAVSLPLGTSAPVKTIAANNVTGAQEPIRWRNAAGTTPALGNYMGSVTDSSITSAYIGPTSTAAATGVTGGGIYPTNLYADLSAATAATINAIRTAFQIQRLLERDARGGTRYVENILSHFGVRSPDYRLQRPEYIGGGKSYINTSPVAQTSSTDATSPQGNLAAFTHFQGDGHRFNYAATEHGYIIGLASVRTDLTYQQGLRRHWVRSTRYDYYWPAFAHLGEQNVLLQEIYARGTAADVNTFGYQERWAEYRYTPNEICGLFRSTTPNNIDVWHYAQNFVSAPLLNDTFITDPSSTVLERSLAVGSAADGQQILWDSVVKVRATRPMPTYSVPGLIDHF